MAGWLLPWHVGPFLGSDFGQTQGFRNGRKVDDEGKTLTLHVQYSPSWRPSPFHREQGQAAEPPKKIRREGARDGQGGREKKKTEAQREEVRERTEKQREREMKNQKIQRQWATEREKLPETETHRENERKRSRDGDPKETEKSETEVETQRTQEDRL